MDGADEARGADAAPRDARRTILDAAARILRHNGTKATTLRDIAAAVGIKAGSIYYHFASKDAIVAAVMNDGVERVHETVTRALEGLPRTAGPAERLEAAIAAHLHALLDHSDYTSAGLKAFTDAPEAVRAAARPVRKRYEAVWDGIVADLATARLVPDDVPAETLALAILGMMNWSPEWYRADRHAIDRLARDFASIVLRPPSRL
ncbi:TetR/AcrR family transcriptional regulator [Phreatobacter sp.]|uniref:TetR/AcrR family transcriptional regulator n=1 Tax=Phreatobacter sp. TaxID=1966341 RepID=UPI0022BD5CC5|nr:TetR/AcrR family transcriptional regulator [Phreatobacter sp.]MCZ8316928.1 TetR/AcrR family transcriptional regulator [Phreatobacter sp.]